MKMRIAVSIAIIIIVMATPSFAWWNHGEVLVSGDPQNYPADPVADCLSRMETKSNNTDVKFGGSDTWFVYNMVDNFSHNNSVLNIKLLKTDFTVPMTTSWVGPLRFDSVFSDYSQYYGYQLKAEYTQIAMNPIDFYPTAWITFWADDGQTSFLNIARVRLDFPVPGSPELVMDNTNILTTIDIAGIQYSDIDITVNDNSKVIRVIWTVPTSSGFRIEGSDITATRTTDETGAVGYEYSAPRNLIVQDNIVSVINPRPRIVMNQNQPGQSIIVWEELLPGFGNQIVAKAVDKSGNSYPNGPTGDPLQIAPGRDPHIVHTDLSPETCSAWIVWQYTNTETNIKRQAVRFYNDVGWTLEKVGDPAIIRQSNDFGKYSIVTNNGYAFPRGLSYDSNQDRLIICDEGNSRVQWIEEVSSEPGCWYSECEGYRVDYLHYPKGQISRYKERSAGFMEIGNHIITALVSTGVDPGMTMFDLNRDDLPLRDVDVKAGPEGTSYYLEDLTLFTDAYSRTSAVYSMHDGTVQNSVICWNSDVFLKQASGPVTYDHLDHPYDSSVVPPVWTPTATPAPPQGSTATPTPAAPTPTPTSTPQPGYWVADMHRNRLVRLNYHNEIQAQTHVEPPVSQPTWSPLENCDLIAPSAVSAAYDGSCWAIDWGRKSVVKIGVDGTRMARTDPNVRPGILHPAAIDCAGDPHTCFVADYAGNAVYKVTWNPGTGSLTLTPSEIDYFQPFAIEVQRLEDAYGQLWEFVWVSDKKNLQPTPAPGTWTPLPTWTPVPGAGTPTAVPPTATPYHETRRVSLNRFGFPQYEENVGAVPVGLSAIGDTTNYKCYVADRDANVIGKNEIKLIEPGVMTRIRGDSGHTIRRPTDVEAIE